MVRRDPQSTPWTSRRERTLWLWASGAVLIIFGSLGVTPVVAGELRARGLLEATFVLGLVLVLGAVIAHGVRARADLRWWLPMGVMAVALLLAPRLADPAERTHLIEYSIVALIVYEALRERAKNRPARTRPELTAFALTTLIGGVDEGVQHLIPSRVFDPIDIGFNTLAAAFAISASAGLRWLRQRPERSS